MANYGQFCSVARAHEVLGGRWTLLVVRELLCGSRRFNDIRRGIPRISRTMLSERLQELVHVGAVGAQRWRSRPGIRAHRSGQGADDPGRRARRLGSEMAAAASSGRGSRCRAAAARYAAARAFRCVAEGADRRALRDRPASRRASCCSRPDEARCARTIRASPSRSLFAARYQPWSRWWRGDVGFAAAQRLGLSIEAPRALARAFPGWFERYQFADIQPATHEPARADA